VASLLRLKDNHCHLEEAERVLIKNRKLTGARNPKRDIQGGLIRSSSFWFPLNFSNHMDSLPALDYSDYDVFLENDGERCKK
jgi:hypothetical protein